MSSDAPAEESSRGIAYTVPDWGSRDRSAPIGHRPAAYDIVTLNKSWRTRP